MFAGKTDELQRYVRRFLAAKQRFHIFTYSCDTCCGVKTIATHDGNRLVADAVHSGEDILRRVDDITRIVIIDEAQFFQPDIVDAIRELSARDVHVIMAGLDMDHIGNPFGSMPQLMAVADNVYKLKAICTVCGNEAARTIRISPLSRQESPENEALVGGSDIYEARCANHIVECYGESSDQSLYEQNIVDAQETPEGKRYC